MVLFTLSCFALLLFLWISFGGPTPLKPQAYRVVAAFPEAATLAEEADVRISGVTVGTVRQKVLDAPSNRTIVTMDVDEPYAPIPSDTRAILRQKTLLGETYVELTPGSRTVAKIPDGGMIKATNIAPTTELDEILRIFDPRTKRAFRQFSSQFAKVTEGSYPEDLNDAFGNLTGTAVEGADVFNILDQQEAETRQLVKNTGVVFGALHERQGALRQLVTNSNNTFEATASEQGALAQIFQIFPTFLKETRTTLARLDDFSDNTDPLVNDLKPVAVDLGPTVRDLGHLSPDLESLLHELNPLVDASRNGLPAAERFLRGARPLFEGLHKFLPELNPILAYVNYGQVQLAQFLTAGGAGITPGTNTGRGQHGSLGQFAMIDGRSLALNRMTPPIFRGTGYPTPNYLRRARSYGAMESFTCDNTTTGKEEVDPIETGLPAGIGAEPPCFETPDHLFSGTKFPQVRGGTMGIWNAKKPPAFSPSPQANDGTECNGPPKGSVGGNSRDPIQLCSEKRSEPYKIPGSRAPPKP
jgi:virulence factor Mce-like protein